MSKKNYNKAYREARMENNPIDEAVNEDVVDTVVNSITMVDASVVNCEKLNIRSEPDKTAEILEVVDKSSKLTIFPDDSTEDWYKVRTEDGVEGFCMKEYVI